MNSFFFQTICRYSFSLLVLLCIIYISFAPPSAFVRIPVFEHEDKLVHLLMYFGFTLALIFDYTRKLNRTNKSRVRFVSIAVLFPVIIGGIIEVLQPVLSGMRSASFIDWIFDVFGSLLAWWLIPVLLKKIGLKQ